MNERSIFLQALEKEDATERSAYLETACGTDTALRQRVELLLQSHTEAGSFLDIPLPQQANEQAAQAVTPDELGQTQTLTNAQNAADVSIDFLEPSQRAASLGRIGHYEVLEVIGRGGFGIVLRAFDEKLHRVVAVKVLSNELASSGSAKKRFKREARAAAAVTHDNVVAIHAVEDAGPLPFLVMQFVDGRSLQDKIAKEGSLELKAILRIGSQIAAGLAAAHRQGQVHRDIKPANILLENGVERVKITDFGLARAVDDASLTHSGVIAGTPQYMSPEQADGKPVDHRSDLFSLGSVMYAMCTGRAPFRAESTMATLRRVCDDTPRPIRELNPDIPEWLCEIIAKLHAKHPAERYQTAKELAGLLEERLADVQKGVTPSSIALASPAASAAGLVGEIAPEATPAKPEAAKLVRWLLTLLALGGGVQLVVLAFLFSRGLVMQLAIVASVIGAAGLALLVGGGYARTWLSHGNRARVTLVVLLILGLAMGGVGVAGVVVHENLSPQGAWMNAVEQVTVVAGILSGVCFVTALALAFLNPAGRGLQPATASGSPAPKRRWPRRLAWGSAAVVVLLLAILGFAYRLELTGYVTDTGYIEIENRVDAELMKASIRSVRVLRNEDLQEVASIDLERQPRIRLAPGHYRLALGQGTRWEALGKYYLDVDPSYLDLGRGKVHRVALRVMSIGEPALVGEHRGHAGHPTEWTPLFNGKDLSGWNTQPADSKHWTVENGILVGSGDSPSFLVSERGDYKNFHFRIEARLNADGDSGQYFRCQPDESVRRRVRTGYEAQLTGPANLRQNGSLFKFVDDGKIHDLLLTNQKLVQADTWFVQEVIANGPKIVIKLNDKTVAEWDDAENPHLSGHLALDIWKPGSRLEVRKIEIKELPARQPATAAKTDEELLQGPWQAVSFELDGENILGGPLRSFNGNISGKTLHVAYDGDFNKLKASTRDMLTKVLRIPPDFPAGEGKAEHDVVFALDPQKTPKTITARWGFFDLKGIYDLQGDTLKVCANLALGAGTPTEFVAPPGTATVLVTLKRRPADPRSDHQKLQGKWRLVSGESKGRPSPVQELKHFDWITFTGDEVTFNSFWGSGKESVIKGRFTLNPDTQPKQMDFIFANPATVNRLIYDLVDDTLVLAHGDPKNPRPTSFTTTPETKWVVERHRREMAEVRPGTDERLLQGTWKGVAGEIGGKPWPETQSVRNYKIVFEGGKFRLSPPGAGEAVIEGTYQLSPQTDPKQITFFYKLPTAKHYGQGIYRFEGDQLRLHLSGDRPTAFVTKPGEENTGYLVLLEREPDANQTDLQDLQGRWLPVSGEITGRPLPAAKLKEIPMLVFAGGEWQQWQAEAKSETRRGNFRINAKASPKEIDLVGWTGEGANQAPGYGIYRLEGDRLSLCLANAGKPRPIEFKTGPLLENLILEYRREAAKSESK